MMRSKPFKSCIPNPLRFYEKSFYILLVYLGCQFVLYALFLLIYALFAPDHKIHYELFGQQPEAMGYYLLATDVILYLALRKLRLIRTPLWPAKSVRPPLRGGIWAIVGVLLFSIGISSVGSLLQLQDNGTTDQFGQMIDNPICLLTLCLAGPLIEEIIFREGILRKLSESGTAAWAAILASSVLFSVAHNNPAQSLPALLTGALLGVLYVGIGDIRLCATAHVLSNILAAALLLANRHAPQSLPQLTGTPLILTASGCIILGLLFIVIWWKRRAPYSFLSDCRKSPDYL